MSEQIEKIARDLRTAAFPGASAWDFCSGDVRERWINAARYTISFRDRGIDDALRAATAAAHDCGNHEAAKAIRELRKKIENDSA